jgi:hypothetical protein
VTGRFQRTDCCLVIVNDTTSERESSFVAMTSDGMTITRTVNASWSGYEGIALFMDGVQSKIGSFNKDTGAAPDGQTVASSHGFTVAGAIFTGTSTTSPGSPQTQALWNLGATDMTNSRAVGLTDIDAADPTQADSVWRSGAVIDLSESAGGTTSSVATWAGSDTDSFDLTWNPNSGNAGQQLYCLIG